MLQNSEPMDDDDERTEGETDVNDDDEYDTTMMMMLQSTQVARKASQLREAPDLHCGDLAGASGTHDASFIAAGIRVH